MPLRSYTLGRRPAVILLAAGVDELDASVAFERSVRETLGIEVFVRSDEGRFRIPAPHEARIDGRALRGEEYARYADGCFDAATACGATQVLCVTDHMYVLDWDAFDRAAHQELDRIYRALPGWQGHGARLLWYGPEPTSEPVLRGSVEPPGLQVSGVMEMPALRAWHRAFLRATRHLPHRAI